MKQLSGQGLCSGPRETTTWSPISTISLKGTRSHPEWLRNLGGLQKASNRNSWTRRPAATTTFGILGHALVWNMRSFLLLLFVMWSSRTECGWCYIVAPETSAMPDSLIRDNPRLHCNDMAMYCMRIVAPRNVMWRDVYFHVVSVVFSVCWIWS